LRVKKIARTEIYWLDLYQNDLREMFSVTITPY